MANTFKIYEDLQDSFSEQQARALTKIISQVIIDESNIVTKVEFNRLERIMEELAEAQKKTEETVRQLVIDMADVKKQLGGLSMAVGYDIEDKYMPFMKKFALNQYNAVINKVERKNVKYANGAYDEVNLYLEGERNGKKIYIIGESKAQPGKKDVDKFDLMLKRLEKHFNAEVKGFMIGYIYAPEVEDYLIEKYPHIDFFKTYQIEDISGTNK